jgi:hypothetical protein
MKLMPAAVQRVLSSQEQNELHEALETFVRDRAGQVMDLR